MAHTFIKAAKYANSALGILRREQVLGGLVTTYGLDDFRLAHNDTLNIPIRAITNARTMAMRLTGSAREILTDDLTESTIAVKLDTIVYNAVEVTDEQWTLDFVDFGAQVLEPQTIAVTEGIEAAIHTKIEGARYHSDNVVEWDTSSEAAYRKMAGVSARLDKWNVPASERILLVGPEAQLEILADERLDSANPEGLGQSALRDNVIGRFAGFTIVRSNLVADDRAYAFHRSAFALGSVAPVKPRGAFAYATASAGGFNLAWFGDYDSKFQVDRSTIKGFIGTGATEDGPVESGNKTMIRAVKIELS